MPPALPGPSAQHARQLKDKKYEGKRDKHDHKKRRAVLPEPAAARVSALNDTSSRPQEKREGDEREDKRETCSKRIRPNSHEREPRCSEERARNGKRCLDNVLSDPGQGQDGQSCHYESTQDDARPLYLWRQLAGGHVNSSRAANDNKRPGEGYHRQQHENDYF